MATVSSHAVNGQSLCDSSLFFCGYFCSKQDLGCYLFKCNIIFNRNSGCDFILESVKTNNRVKNVPNFKRVKIIKCDKINDTVCSMPLIIIRK